MHDPIETIASVGAFRPRQPRMRRPRVFACLITPLLAVVCACVRTLPADELIFLDGRAVASGGDSILAITKAGTPGVLLRNRETGTLDTLGMGELTSSQHVQWQGGKWYASDVTNGRPSIVVFSADGSVERRVPLEGIASAPHQFAILPDGRIVVEAPDGQLIALKDGESSMFALTQRSPRSGFLVAAKGGVLHAIPDRTITLYNALGRIRWRLEWPWAESAFVADLAVDSQGRPHVLAGQEGREGFVVFGISPETGEVGRWSEEGPYATFVVRPLGDIRPDSAGRWTAP